MGPDPAAGVPAARRELREAAEAFESLLISMMIRSMRKAQLSSGFFGESTGASTYEAILDRHLAPALAEGSPLGIAERLEQKWAGRLGKPAEALYRENLPTDRNTRKYPATNDLSLTPERRYER